jgi:hypothetical protein
MTSEKHLVSKPFVMWRLIQEVGTRDFFLAQKSIRPHKPATREMTDESMQQVFKLMRVFSCENAPSG